MPRKLSTESRRAMSDGAKKARSAIWGDKRKPGRKIWCDADVVDCLMSVVHVSDRRRVISDGVADAVAKYSSSTDRRA